MSVNKKKKYMFSMTEADKLVNDFITIKRISMESLTRENTNKLKTAIANASQVDDPDVLIYTGIVFKDDYLCNSFRRHLKSKWEALNQEGQTEWQQTSTEPTVYTLELSDSENCNAVLFIFETVYPQKLLLKVSSPFANVFSAVHVKVSTDSLVALLHKEGVVVPGEDGIIDDKGCIGSLRILMYKFANVTGCSSTSSADFNGVDITEQLLFPPLQLSRNVGWSFFSLRTDPNIDLKEDFELPDRLLPNSQYVYPEPKDESFRVTCLLKAIQNYYKLNQNDSMADITKIENPGFKHHYCQFSGGGDIYIQSTIPVVILSQPVKEGEQDPSLSPKNELEHISTMVIEGKKMDCNSEAIRNQLFANIILLCVTSFIDNLEKKKCCESFIRKMDQLSAYGIAYTGRGHIGFYKLQMKFFRPMEFVTKVKLALRPQPSAACYVDYVLDYFFKKLEQLNNE